MLTIRLQRTGTKNRPSFRIVLAEATKSASKLAQEVLGHYNPSKKEFSIKNEERLKYWLSQHVHLSPSVHNLLVDKKFIAEKKVKAWRPKVKEKAKDDAAPQAATPVEAAPAPAETTAPAPVAQAPVEPQA